MKAEQGKWAEAIETFLTMPEPGSRIYFNIASMYLRLGDLAAAEDVSFELWVLVLAIHKDNEHPCFWMQSLNICVEKDPHLALGFFQRGCLHLQNKK